MINLKELARQQYNIELRQKVDKLKEDVREIAKLKLRGVK